MSRQCGPSPRWAPALLFVFFACLYILVSPGVLNSPDAGTRLLTAIQLARTGSIEIADSDFPELDLSSFELARNRDGHWVEMFNEGQSLLLTPMVALLGLRAWPDFKRTSEFVVAAGFFPLLSALTLVAFWYLLHTLSPDSPRENLVACLLLGAATPCLVYAYNGQHEMQLALLLILHTWALVLHGRAPRPGPLVAAGLCLGLILLLRYTCLPLAPVSGLWIAASYRGRPYRAARAILLYATAGLLVYLPQLYWNYVKLGHLVGQPTELWGRGTSWLLSMPPLEGAQIFLLAPAESVFLYTPISLVSVWALFRLGWRFWQEEYAPLYLYVGALVSLVLCWVGWRDEIAWGPRLFVHVSFLLLLPTWLLLRLRPSKVLWSAVGLAAVIGALVQLLGTLYASENDYGALRAGPEAYGVARPSYVPYLAYRFRDLGQLLTRRQPFVPARFAGLERPQSWVVPQWWWVRLWAHPEYGVSRTLILVAVSSLLIGFLVTLAALACLAHSPLPASSRNLELPRDNSSNEPCSATQPPSTR